MSDLQTDIRREDPLLEHDYDGIREYDNPMPGWWQALFLLTIAFAVGYGFWLHGGGGGKTVHQEYEEEVAAALALELKNAPPVLTEAELAAAVADHATVAAGAAKFKEVCIACHGEKAEGKIGPNLTDKYWIHGKGTLADIYQTISKGVPEKGMPVWSRNLKPAELKNLAAFVGSLRNTNVAGKAAQGNAVEIAAAPAAAPVPAAVPAPAPLADAVTPALPVAVTPAANAVGQ